MNKIVVLADPGEDETNAVLKNYQLPGQFVDSPPPSRLCFWKSLHVQLSDSNKTQTVPTPIVRSIAKHPTSSELVDSTKLLVVSWDSANGDRVYRSDETLAYLGAQGRTHLGTITQNGGVIFVESQTSQSKPVQAPYDAVFGPNQVTVARGSLENAHGTHGRIAKFRSRHPLVSGLGPTHVTPKPNTRVIKTTEIFRDYPEPLKPKKEDGAVIPSIRFDPDDGRSESIWFGWFESWGPNWVPLIDLESSLFRRRPILLARWDKNGLLLASTMWPSASQIDLASRIVEISIVDKVKSEVQRYHRLTMIKRRTADLIAILAVLAVVVGLTSVIVAISRDESAAWILSVAGVGFIGIAAVGLRACKWVWSRPFSAWRYRLGQFPRRTV